MAQPATRVPRASGAVLRAELLSTICHDLKDPLASIVMGAAFLGRILPTDDATASARRVVEAIQRSADRMNKVIGEFSDVAKLEMNQLTLSIQSHPVDALVRDAHDQVVALTKGHGIEVSLSVAPALDGLQVASDRARLVQSIGYLAATLLRSVPETRRLEMQVQNKGSAIRFQLQGVPDAASARQQPAAPRRRDEPLALAIAKRLVELQGGRITTVRGRAGAVGFSFALPLVAAAQPAPREASRPTVDR